MRAILSVFVPLVFAGSTSAGAGPPKLEIVPLAGPQYPCAAISGNGKYCVTPNHEYTYILWETFTGRTICSFRFPPLSRIVISDDGSRIVSGSMNYRDVILWDANTGEQLRTFSGHKGNVRAIAMSGDGKWIVSATEKGEVIQWNAAGEKLREFSASERKVTSLSLSGDGSRLLAIDSENRGILYDVASGKKLHDFAQKPLASARPHLTSDGKHVVTAATPGRDSQLIVWDAASGKRVHEFVPDSAHVTSLAIDDAGRHVATGSRDGTVMVWDIATGKRLHRLPAHDKDVFLLTLSSDGKHLLSAGHDKLILWQTSDARNLRVLPAPRLERVRALDIDRGGNLLLVGCRDSAAVLWDLAAGKPSATFEASSATYDTVLSGDGKVVAIGDASGATLWDAKTRAKLRTFPSPTRFLALAINHDGTRLVTSAAEKKMAILWDATTGKELQTFMHGAALDSVAIDGDGKYVATASVDDRKAMLWDAATGKKLQTFAPHSLAILERVLLSADGKHLATYSGGFGDWWSVWDTATGERVRTVPKEVLPVTRLSPKSYGRAIAVAGDARRTWHGTSLRDVDADKEICRLYTFEAGKEWLVLTPDGFFDGSEAGRSLVALRAAGTSKLVDAPDELRRLYRPGLLARLWKVEKP